MSTLHTSQLSIVLQRRRLLHLRDLRRCCHLELLYLHLPYLVHRTLHRILLLLHSVIRRRHWLQRSACTICAPNFYDVLTFALAFCFFQAIPLCHVCRNKCERRNQPCGCVTFCTGCARVYCDNEAPCPKCEQVVVGSTPLVDSSTDFFSPAR